MSDIDIIEKENNEDDSVVTPDTSTEVTEPDVTDPDITGLDVTDPEEPELEIELVIEDGSGVENANSYVSLEFADSYFQSRGRTDWAELSDNNKKYCLIKGTDYIDNFYTWKGRRKYPSQVLSFPRVLLKDNDNFDVVGIPVKLQKAVCESAYLSINESTLFITKETSGQIKKEKVDVLETEYFENKDSNVDYTSIYTVLNKFLSGFFKTNDDVASFNVGAYWSN